MVKVYCLIVLLLLSQITFSDFELRSLKVGITLNPDGSAHATETARLFMTNTPSIRTYEDSVVFNDLSSWSTRTGINDLRTHVSRAYVDIVDLRVRPQPVDGCNNLAETCYGTLILDYDIYPIEERSPGLVSTEIYKPRTTRHTLRSEAFTFPRTKTDDIILSKGYTLQISVPDTAKLIMFSRVPDNIGDDSQLFRFDPISSNNYYVGEVRTFIWEDQTLSQFSLSYEIEQSLEEEISDFVTNLQTDTFNLLLSESGIAYILTSFSLLLPLIWLHSLKTNK